MTEHDIGRRRTMMVRRVLGISVVTTALALGAATGVGGWMAPRALSAPAPVTPKTQTPSEARALSHSFSTVAKALAPSVVRIDVESEQPRLTRNDRRQQQVPPELERLFERFFGEQFDFPPPNGGGPGLKGTGSGVVLDNHGFILTNSHVVENAAKLTVSFSDGREFSAKVVGRDPDTDVAVVKLEKPPANLVAARIGDSTKMEVGEWVLAIGSPLASIRASPPASSAARAGSAPTCRCRGAACASTCRPTPRSTPVTPVDRW
jgi:serine protease Do